VLTVVTVCLLLPSVGLAHVRWWRFAAAAHAPAPQKTVPFLDPHVPFEGAVASTYR
jgi:hypothetical protein